MLWLGALWALLLPGARLPGMGPLLKTGALGQGLGHDGTHGWLGFAPRPPVGCWGGLIPFPAWWGSLIPSPPGTP